MTHEIYACELGMSLPLGCGAVRQSERRLSMELDLVGGLPPAVLPLERGKEGKMVAASGREATAASVTRNANWRGVCRGSLQGARVKRCTSGLLAALAILFASATAA